MPPVGLVDIATACKNRGYVNTIGVVVDFLTVSGSKGSSSSSTFEIKDDNFDQPPMEGSLKIRFFKDNDSHLPHVQKNDVILLRNIKITEFNGRSVGLVSNRQNVPWAIFRAQDDPSRGPAIIQGPETLTPTSPEQRKAHALLDRVLPLQKQQAGRKEQSTVVEASMPTPKAYRLRLIKDVESNIFCELVAQVVKKHYHDYDQDKCTLWVTDYTSNDALPDHEKNPNMDGTEGDTYGYISGKKQDWPGPWGKQTLQITLWDPHASYANNKVQLNDIVHLGYVRPKFSRMGDLEAVISQDRKFESRVHIKKVSAEYDTHAQELMKRRKEYWSVHGEQKESSKPAKKKKTKEPEKIQRKEEEPKFIKPSMPARTSRAKNPKVKIRNYGIPNSSIDDILSAKTHVISLPGGLSYQAPFQNVGYTLTGRVVDFYPPKLEDFAKLVPSDSIVDGNESWTWEWRFCLLVEGVEPLMSKNQRRERLKIFVAGAEAEHLLLLDATDLRQDSERLAELREKLFVLWGNLEEMKQANRDKGQSKEPPKLSSLPFECCIQEYGVPCRHSEDSDAMAIDGEPCTKEGCFGWERRFSLYGTTIDN